MEGRVLQLYPFSLSASFMICDLCKDSKAVSGSLLFLFRKTAVDIFMWKIMNCNNNNLISH